MEYKKCPFCQVHAVFDSRHGDVGAEVVDAAEQVCRCSEEIPQEPTIP